MTAITRPVTRETGATIRDAGRSRPIVVTLTSAGFLLRQKGTRRPYLLPFAAAYNLAVQLHVREERAKRANQSTATTQKRPPLVTSAR